MDFLQSIAGDLVIKTLLIFLSFQITLSASQLHSCLPGNWLRQGQGKLRHGIQRGCGLNKGLHLIPRKRNKLGWVPTQRSPALLLTLSGSLEKVLNVTMMRQAGISWSRLNYKAICLLARIYNVVTMDHLEMLCDAPMSIFAHMHLCVLTLYHSCLVT